MENRDAIVKKLNALRAKANGAGTPQEAMAFLAKYEELMEKYKLTETDLEIKDSSIRGINKTPKKTLSLVERVCRHIATLTDTVAVKGPLGITFIGYQADLDYADWLYDLIVNSLERGLNVLPTTPLYHKLLNAKVKPLEIKENYKIGFLSVIMGGLSDMIEAKKVKGNALVVLKHALILSFIEENGGTKQSKSQALKLYDGAHEAALAGFEEGSKVKLRQGVESVVKGYLA